MQFIENPWNEIYKRTKVMNEEELDASTVHMELADTINVMTKVLYEREYIQNRSNLQFI